MQLQVKQVVQHFWKVTIPLMRYKVLNSFRKKRVIENYEDGKTVLFSKPKKFN